MTSATLTHTTADAPYRRTEAFFWASLATMAAAILLAIGAAVLKMLAADSPLLPAIVALGVAFTATHLVVALVYAAQVREWTFVALTYFAVVAAGVPLLYAIFGTAPFDARF